MAASSDLISAEDSKFWGKFCFLVQNQRVCRSCSANGLDWPNERTECWQMLASSRSSIGACSEHLSIDRRAGRRFLGRIVIRFAGIRCKQLAGVGFPSTKYCSSSALFSGWSFSTGLFGVRGKLDFRYYVPLCCHTLFFTLLSQPLSNDFILRICF